MNDITRCPNCQTAFRVTEAQLQAHRGKVRCGRCAFVFNANECLEIEQKVEIVSEITAPSPVKVTKTIEATEAIEVREPIQPSAAQIMAAAITDPLVPKQDNPAPLITPAIAEPIEPLTSLSEPNETAALAPSALAEPIEIPTRHSALNETAALVVPPPIADSIEPRPSRPKRIVLDSDEPKVDFASIGMTTISEPEVETMAEAPLAPPKPQSQAAFETAHGYHPILTEDDDALLAQQPERSKWQGLFIAMSIILMLSFAAQLAY
ncbi:MAG: zinc-ribbon domain-containing protein, partial [Burkholderiales bacterium]|nr:zinc-ribbon domain-containing protein [Burkholderiales bacterium]